VTWPMRIDGHVCRAHSLQQPIPSPIAPAISCSTVLLPLPSPSTPVTHPSSTLLPTVYAALLVVCTVCLLNVAFFIPEFVLSLFPTMAKPGMYLHNE
jgi:hypothetical protein